MMTDQMRNRKLKGTSQSRPDSPLVWIGLAKPAAWKFVLILISILGSGLTVVSMSHQNRSLFNELQQSRSHANNLDVQWGQLLIEQSTFGLEGRIEQKAVEQLNLRVPEMDKIIMVTND